MKTRRMTKKVRAAPVIATLSTLRFIQAIPTPRRLSRSPVAIPRGPDMLATHHTPVLIPIKSSGRGNAAIVSLSLT